MCLNVRLEIENARLEATAKHQSNKMETLQKGAQEAAMVSTATLLWFPADGILMTPYLRFL